MESPTKMRKKQLMTAVIGASLVIGVIFFGMWLTDPKRKNDRNAEVDQEKRDLVAKNFRTTSEKMVSPEEVWVTKSETRIKEIETENSTLKAELAKLKDGISDIKKKDAISDAVSDTQAALKSVNQPLPPPKMVTEKKTLENPVGSAKRESPSFQSDRGGYSTEDLTDPEIVSIDFTRKTPENKNGRNIETYIPSGTFASIVLLSGVDAPTGDLAKSDPIPVLMKVQNFAQLPNKFKSKIKECTATGAMHGSMSAERGYIRLETISCVLEDKRVIDTQLWGYVAGEDGKAGFRGKVVSKQGSLIAKAALAGTAAGIGQTLSNSANIVSQSALGSVTTIDPNKTLQAGMYNGAGTALSKIADFYIARANETFPIIEIDAGRRGEMILTKGSNLEFKIGDVNEK